MRAAEAGVHVLCEKPLAMSVQQAQQMVDACADAGVLLQEAFMYRHHPTWVEVARLVRDGHIGDLRAIQTWFSYYNDDPTNIRNRPENGGGAVMDIGCYPISVARFLFDAEPDDVRAVVHTDPDTGVDILTSAVLRFGPAHATFTVGTQVEPYQRVHVIGTAGRIEVEIPFNAPVDRPTRIFVTSGGEPPTAPATEIEDFARTDQYTLQADAFSRAVLDHRPAPLAPTDALANMIVIDAVRESAR